MILSIGGLVTFIIVLVALALVVWLAFYILANFNPPEPLGRVIRVAIVAIAILIIVAILLQFAGYGGFQITR